MASFCLNPQLADQFKKDILSGKIDPEKLAAMTSQERHAFFAESLGEANATGVNALFESKLLLKNKQAGMVNWARKVLGENTPAGRDIISKIKRMDKILSPAEENAFLEELASQRLGTHVTYDEAQKITELSQKITETKAAMDNGGDRMEYGRAVVALRNYVADLKGKANALSKADFKAPGRLALKVANSIAGNAKAIKASMDNSSIFRQGWKPLLTHPGVWQKNARQSFVDLVQTFGGKEVLNEVDADIASRPNSLNNYYTTAKLDVGVVEESYPTSLPEKIPVVGRVYKASEVAFTAFVRRTRADVFDKYIDIAKESGVNLDDKSELESIGRLVNSLTGRGHLGPLEPAAKVINNVFFSPRALKANIDTLLLHPTDKMSGFARKQAAYNLLKIVGGIAAILAIAKALRRDSVDFDPRSADFGKIRIKDTRFDVSAGMSSVVTLASRLITQSTKSSTTGQVNKLNSGKYGAQTGTDVVYNFFENKLSPVSAVVKDLLKGQDFNGDKPTVTGELRNLLTPLPVTTFLELKNNPNSANILASMIADGLGIATNTYSAKPKKTKH
ncbi:MAG: transcription factor S-II central domain-containing protein [Acidobacteriota bacterium]|nr:transcription factor S-II central domain-containing protein [Acidobacteriota bacterium]